MPKELRAGISINDGTIQTVVLEFHSDGIMIRYLHESVVNGRKDRWYLEAISKAREGVSGKISSVAVVLDYDDVFLHSFPMDTSLTQPEQNEHVQWELSNYVENFKPREYISDIHILRTRARDQVSDIMAVNVKRDLLFSIQQALAKENIDLQLADIHHFGAQYSLLTSYPEVRAKTVALIGVSKKRIDTGILVDGRLKTYRYLFASEVDQYTAFLHELVTSTSCSDAFLYGTSASSDVVKNLREALTVNTVVLNPFRKLAVSPSFRNFDEYAGREHHFASCLGCVMRQK